MYELEMIQLIKNKIKKIAILGSIKFWIESYIKYFISKIFDFGHWQS